MFHTKKPKERVRLQQARMGEGVGGLSWPWGLVGVRTYLRLIM